MKIEQTRIELGSIARQSIPLSCAVHRYPSYKQYNGSQDHSGATKYLHVVVAAVLNRNKSTGNRISGQTSNAANSKHHTGPQAHLAHITGQAGQSGGEKSLHGVGANAINNDKSFKATEVMNLRPAE